MAKLEHVGINNYKAKSRVFVIKITYDFKTEKWTLTIKLFKFFSLEVDISSFVKNIKNAP